MGYDIVIAHSGGIMSEPTIALTCDVFLTPEGMVYYHYPPSEIVFYIEGGTLYALNRRDTDLNVFSNVDSLYDRLSDYGIPMYEFELDFFNKGLVLSDAFDMNTLALVN